MKASVDAVFMWEAMIVDGTKVTFDIGKLCKRQSYRSPTRFCL